FNTKLYTGDGATTLAVSGVGFQPDFTWIKNRDQADDHTLVDSVRGATKYLVSNDTDAEVDDSTFVASLDSDGFTVGDDVVVNTSTENYASWNWKAGGTAVSNTDGTITSSVSANTDAGFSIVTYSGNLTAGATVGHGLGVVPSMMIFHRLNTGGTDWIIYHSTLGATQNLAFDTSAAITSSTRFNNTAPSSSVFTLGTTVAVNGSADTYVAYCFHSVDGYSKVGSYEGNNNVDGAFVYCGFKVSMVLIKNIDSAGNDWLIFDDKRDTYNLVNQTLFPNASDDEATASTGYDFVSNGFKARSTAANKNQAYTYLYYAVAESPFKYSNAR
ncbi:MAG: hypothetical protein QF535_10530, partial [Anaerolineales bacterium]|nr:hypothetical protein [Anaerolineales bacterium]